MDHARDRAPTRTRLVLAGWAVVLIGGLGVAPLAGAGQAEPTYRWHGELVALDEATRALTVTSRIVTREPQADLETLETGDPIVITWSGFEDRAHGIRAVRRDAPGRFQLPVEFVAADRATRYLTFRVRPPVRGVAALDTLEAGAWTTLTSPHQPGAGGPPVRSVTPYAGSRPGAVPPDHYRWNAELVGHDADGLVLRARVVSEAGLADLAGLRAGEPLQLTWSGYAERAHGIHRVIPERFRLAATFVATDASRRYLTFRLPVSTAQLTALAGLGPGDWATVASPHQRTPRQAVVAAAPFVPAPPAPARARATTFQWHAELVAYTPSSLVVRARVVTRDGLAAVARLQPEDAVTLTWSGFDDRAHGIRRVSPAAETPLAAPFQLPAVFVAADPATQYVTFRVQTPPGSRVAAGALEPGTWTTITSPHPPHAGETAVLLVDAYDRTRRARRYAWTGELRGLDPEAAAVEVAAPVEPHVFRYLDRFTEGDEVVLMWKPGSAGEVTAIRYLEPRAGSILDHGYVLPVTFRGADATTGQLVFTARVPPHTLVRWTALEPGTPIKVTALFEQRGDTAAILTVESTDAG